MVRGNPRVRDMMEIEIIANEIRHDIETAKCPGCNETVEAPNNLPKKGSYGRTLVGLIAELRAARTPLAVIPGIIKYVADIDKSTSTVSNVVGRIGDSVGDVALEITKAVEKSPHAGFDETAYKDNGIKKWVSVAQSEKNIAIMINSSRATRMPRWNG